MIRRPLSQKSLEMYIEEIEPLTKGFEYLSDHVIITDPNANILYANKAAERNTGFLFKEIVGKNPADFWGGNMPKEFYENMWRTIKQEKKPFVAEVSNRRKNGTTYWQEIHISPVLDANGNIKFFIAIEPNITDRKKREQFREEFISIIGHQLRSPLTTIRWVLDLLAEDKKLTKKQKQALQTLYRENKNLLDLVVDLLTISRVGKTARKNKVKSFDLGSEIDKIIKSVKVRHPNVSLEFHKPQKQILLTAKKELALQVFTNIILNAADYVHEKHGKVTVSLQEQNGQYVFSCKDNGIGIPKKDQKNIFSRFFRASNADKAKKGGTGLGLFIVKMIADSFGWRVSFESQEAKGSTFYVFVNNK